MSHPLHFTIAILPNDVILSEARSAKVEGPAVHVHLYF